MPTVSGAAALAAVPLLTVLARNRPDGLWSAYQAAVLDASNKAQTWRMMRSAAGASGQTGFLYQAAFEAENAADQAYQAWHAAYRAEFPGTTG